MFDFDASGWLSGALSLVPAEAAYALFLPDEGARLAIEALVPHGARLGFDLTMEPTKRFAHGASPRSDAAWITGRAADGVEGTVALRLAPVERAPGLVKEGLAAAAAIGGAGMDALVRRARRVLQVERSPREGDARIALVVACACAGAYLAPILPPERGALFGLKGARERLLALGIG